MKKILFIILTIIAINDHVSGQIYEGWSIGMRGYGFHFWRYNPYEWKVISRDIFYPIETEASHLNGWSGGINLEWRKDYRWAFALGLEYSSQEQKYVSSSGTREDTAGVITILITDDISASFDYVKIPASLIYNLPVEGSNLEFSIYPFVVFVNYSTVFD